MGRRMTVRGVAETRQGRLRLRACHGRYPPSLSERRSRLRATHTHTLPTDIPYSYTLRVTFVLGCVQGFTLWCAPGSVNMS